LCGLVGVMGKTITDDVKKSFHDMLYLDVLRGDDSTGVAAISNAFNDKVEVELFKSVGSAAELFFEHTTSKRARTLTYKPVNIYIGHNRYATQGKINTENAHPFEFPNLVGAHNGTVSMHSIQNFHGWKDYDVDSKIIYSHLSHTQDIKDVWKDADGALALTWFDKQTKKMNFIRNKERPLFYCYTENDQQMLWESEKWMIFIAASRQGVKLQDVVEVKTNTLFSFTINEEGKVCHTEEDIPPFVEKPNYYQQSRNGGYSWMDDYYSQTDKEYPVKKKEEKKDLQNRPFIITEFADVPNHPWARGFLQDGSTLTINIPINRYQEARKRLIGAKERGEQGFFTASKIHKTVMMNASDYWCNWSDCRFVTLKAHMKIVRLPDQSFLFKNATEVSTGFAPTHDENVFLTLPAYTQKTRCGCLNCKQEPLWNERDQLKWIDQASFLCITCQDLPFIKDLLNEEKA